VSGQHFRLREPRVREAVRVALHGVPGSAMFRAA
jgi:hypothetical protein